jgi:uncharacterized protein with PIN domain
MATESAFTLFLKTSIFRLLNGFVLHPYGKCVSFSICISANWQAYLRMVALDTAYRTDYPDEELARISADEKRVLLTRDRGLLKRSVIIRGYFVPSTNPREQLLEVLQRFDLFDSISPFERCMHCNSRLRSVPKETIAERLLPQTSQQHKEFRVCPECDRIYWKGSHYRRMQEFIEAVVARRWWLYYQGCPCSLGHNRRFDAVVVWKFHRFARSVSHLLRAPETFKLSGSHS